MPKDDRRRFPWSSCPPFLRAVAQAFLPERFPASELGQNVVFNHVCPTAHRCNWTFRDKWVISHATKFATEIEPDQYYKSPVEHASIGRS